MYYLRLSRFCIIQIIIFLCFGTTLQKEIQVLSSINHVWLKLSQLQENDVVELANQSVVILATNVSHIIMYKL